MQLSISVNTGGDTYRGYRGPRYPSTPLRDEEEGKNIGERMPWEGEREGQNEKVRLRYPPPGVSILVSISGATLTSRY